MKKFLALIIILCLAFEGIPMYTLAAPYEGVGIHSVFLNFEGGQKADILSSGELIASSAEPDVFIESNGDGIYSIKANHTTANFSGELIDIKSALGTSFEEGDTMLIEADYYNNASTEKSGWGFSLTDGPVGSDLRSPLIWWTARVSGGKRQFIWNGSNWHSVDGEHLGAAAGWYRIKTKIYFAKDGTEESYREISFKAAGDSEYRSLTADGSNTRLVFDGSNGQKTMTKRKYLALFGTSSETKNYVDNLKIVIIKKELADRVNSAQAAGELKTILAAYSKSGLYGFNKDFNTLSEVYKDYLADKMLNSNFADDSAVIDKYNSLTADNLFDEGYLELSLSSSSITAPGGNTATIAKARVKGIASGKNYTATWSVAPSGRGVSISDNGDISISSAAAEGDYTIRADIGGYNKTANLSVSAFRYELYIAGSDAVKIPYKGSISTSYTVSDNLGGANLPATWSLIGSDGVSISDDGALNVTADATAGTYTIVAEYLSDSAAFNIDIQNGSYALKIEGADSLWAFPGKTARSDYTLGVMDTQENKAVHVPGASEAIWTIEGSSDKISIQNGTLSCAYGAEGSYRIKAAYDSMTAYMDVNVYDNFYKIVGTDKIIKPMGNILSKTPYNLVDRYGAQITAPLWSAIGTEYKNGGLIINKNTPDKLSITASSDGLVQSLDIDVAEGILEGFEAFSAGDFIGSNSYGVILEADGDKYASFPETGDNTNDRYTLPIGFSGEYADKVHISFDIKANTGAYWLPAITSTIASSTSWVNHSKYSVSQNGDGSLKYSFSMEYFDGASSRFSATDISVPSDSWVNVDISFDSKNKSYDLYLNNELKLSNLRLRDFGSDSFNIKNLIFTGRYARGSYNNIMTYSGDVYFRKIVYTGENFFSLSDNGGKMSLSYKLYENGSECYDYPAGWQIVSYSDDYSGLRSDLYISNGSLYAKAALSGKVYIKAMLSDEITASTPIEIVLSKASSHVDVSNKLIINGEANKSYTVELYAPSDGDFIDACLESKTTMDLSYTVPTDASGYGEKALTLSENGRYLVKVYNQDRSHCDVHEVYVNTDIMDKPNAAVLLSDDKIVPYLERFSNLSQSEINEAVLLYSALSPSQRLSAVAFMSGDIEKFHLSSTMTAFFGGDNSLKESCIASLNKNGLRSDFVTLFVDDPEYKNIGVASLGEPNLTAAIEKCVKLTALSGINRSSAYPKSAGKYLVLLGNSRYINAGEALKAAIETAVAKGGWTSVTALSSAIAAVKEPAPLKETDKNEPGTQNGSMVNTMGSGGGGGGGTVAKPEPTEPVIPDTKPGQNTALFNDVSGSHWAYSYIKQMKDKGIVDGYMGSFNPEGYITRAEYCKIIFKALGYTGGKGISFYDVAKDSWYYECISALSSLGLVSGYDGYFNPDEPISREAAVTIAARVLDMEGYELSSGGISFTDEADISAWARDYVDVLSGLGIITGTEKGSFEPLRGITRAESCAAISRLLNYIDGGDR